jgi:YVTN family beta-propeller protein
MAEIPVVDDTTPVEFGVLGPLRVLRSGKPVPLGGPRQRAVLALLLLEANRVVSLDRLAEQVWAGRPPDGAAPTLQTYVFHLRAAIEPDRPRGSPGQVLTSRPHGYLLNVPRSSLDAAVFEDLVAIGQTALEAGRYEEAADTFRRALRLWRGPLLADLADADFVRPEAARLEELRLGAVEARVDADLALGRHRALVAELEQLVSQNPLRERLHYQLILTLYRCQRQADALAAYRRVRDLLATELGIDPGEPLQQLHRAVLAQDPVLGPPTAAAAPVHEPTPAPPPPPDAPAKTRRQGRRMLAAGAVVAVLGAGLIAIATRPWEAGPPVLPGNSVGLLNSSGDQVGDPVAVGQSPDGVAFGAGAVWAVNTADGTVSRIDPGTPPRVQTIIVGGTPVAVTVTGDDVWVANSADGKVWRINARSNGPVQPIDVGNRPVAIASGPSGVWVANQADDTVQRIDPVTGRADAPILVGGGPDALAVGQRTVWIANGTDGTVSRINADTGAEAGSAVIVGPGPAGIAVTPSVVWVTNLLAQSVSKIDPSSARVVDTIPVGDGPRSVVATDDAVWVSAEFDGTVSRIDPGTDRVTRREAIGGSPRGLALVGSEVWVAAAAFTAASHRGGTLTVVTRWVPEIDPTHAFTLGQLAALAPVYDELVGLRRADEAAGLTLVPDLATALPLPTDGGRTYTFTLRAGVRYSTGSLVRPADIRRGVERQFSAKGAQPEYLAGIVGGRACLAHPDGCDLSAGIVTDDTASTVAFHLTAPDPEFLYKLGALLLAAAVPPGSPTSTVTTEPLPATGPYMISDVRPDRSLTLVRNPYFHQWSYAAQPEGYPDVIRWQRADTSSDKVAAVTAGTADVLITAVVEVPSTVVDELAVRYPIRLHAEPSPVVSYVMLNTRVPPFDDVRVRRALSYAVDRDALVRGVGGPVRATVSCQVIPAGFPGHEPYCPYTVGRRDGHWHGPDLATARRLVEGSPTRGQTVTVWEVQGDGAGAHVVQALRGLGYRASLRPLPADEFVDGVSDYRRRVQAAVFSWGADYPTASDFLLPVLSCASVRSGGHNLAEYCNPKVEDLYTRAQGAQQTDPGAARRLWAEADRAVTNDSPWIVFGNEKGTSFVSERVGNYQAHPMLGPLLAQMWIH